MRFVDGYIGGRGVTVLEKGSFRIDETDDFLDLMGNAPERQLAIHQEDLAERFFDLSSGFAGEVLQKVSNYGMALTILGDFSGYGSESLQAFIRESNRGGQVQFRSPLELREEGEIEPD